jgi:hypothetical protein
MRRPAFAERLAAVIQDVGQQAFPIREAEGTGSM